MTTPCMSIALMPKQPPLKTSLCMHVDSIVYLNRDWYQITGYWSTMGFTKSRVFTTSATWRRTHHQLYCPQKNERERLLDLDTRIVNQNSQVVLAGQGRVKLLTIKNPTEESEATKDPKVAIVTGGAGGIGKAICLRLAQDGYHVIVNYYDSAARAAK